MEIQEVYRDIYRVLVNGDLVLLIFLLIIAGLQCYKSSDVCKRNTRIIVRDGAIARYSRWTFMFAAETQLKEKIRNNAEPVSQGTVFALP